MDKIQQDLNAKAKDWNLIGIRYVKSLIKVLQHALFFCHVSTRSLCVKIVGVSGDVREKGEGWETRPEGGGGGVSRVPEKV